MAARFTQYDPDEDDQPPAAGAAASADPVVIVHAEGTAEGAPDVVLKPAPETAQPEPAEPFLVPEADLVQVADDPWLGNEEAVDDGPLVNQGEEVQPEEREHAGQGAAEGAPGEVFAPSFWRGS